MDPNAFGVEAISTVGAGIWPLPLIPLFCAILFVAAALLFTSERRSVAKRLGDEHARSEARAATLDAVLIAVILGLFLGGGLAFFAHSQLNAELADEQQATALQQAWPQEIGPDRVVGRTIDLGGMDYEDKNPSLTVERYQGGPCLLQYRQINDTAQTSIRDRQYRYFLRCGTDYVTPDNNATRSTP